MHNCQETVAPSTSYCCQISVHWTCLQNFRYQTLVKLEASGETKDRKEKALTRPLSAAMAECQTPRRKREFAPHTCGPLLLAMDFLMT
jgi:hypothetical protein